MESEYQQAIKTLSRQYYNHEIIRQDYLERRKILIDHMDQKFNGALIETSLKIDEDATNDITQKKF